MQDVTGKLNAVADRIERSGGINSTSGVHFHGSTGLTVVAVAAIVVAVAAVCVVAAWRSADMRELNTLRDDLDVAEAIIMQHEKRINKLEPKP